MKAGLLSSYRAFQLETIRDFHPEVAVVLNVTPNHMDRYESFVDYAAAKHRIFMNQKLAMWPSLMPMTKWCPHGQPACELM